MTAPPLVPANNRWLLALLAGSFLIDVLLAVGAGLGALGALPGGALMVACAMLGTRQPAEGAVAGGLTMLMSTAFVRFSDSVPRSLGINDLLLSEMAAGVTLVVLVIWRCKPLISIPCTALLVVAGLVATFGRTGRFGSFSMFRSLQIGLLLLVGAVVIGVYLRGTTERHTVTELGSLVRRQWPLAAALAILLFLDVGVIETSTTHVLAMGGAVFAGICAFFAPRAPVPLALTATAGIALAPLALWVAESVVSVGRVGEPIVLSEVAATMALIAFVTRWGPRWPAILSTLALSTSSLIALQLRSEFAGKERWSSFGVWLGLLFVVSVATGLYFRSRDRERAQTISVAVTGAQQSERMALARELHDVVAHHVTGIVVQAQAAQLVAGRDPQVAVGALAKIEVSGVEALKAMRFLVASMRGSQKPVGASAATEQATTDLAADLHTVVEHFGGPPVTLDLSFPEQVPHEVGRSVLRLVQESLTNVGKHALGARNVQVQVTLRVDELYVRVSDDGVARRADPVGGSGGYGLVGMRERVELLGGRFTAGPAEPAGWRVEAWLPLGKEGE
ncbi:histidine kinase [Actinocrispum sp. NPDC049592]|uniref:sensor histidine kinase n=1 Tax=Actinocrispum sp. NPDC049592 TaxID=3154835 RepID=UPI00343454F7